MAWFPVGSTWVKEVFRSPSEILQIIAARQFVTDTFFDRSDVFLRHRAAARGVLKDEFVAGRFFQVGERTNLDHAIAVLTATT